MKKINILMVLGIFVLLVGVAQPAYAGVMGGNWIDPLMFPPKYQSPNINEVAHLNVAVSKFEGLLNAYSVNQKTVEQISVAASDLSSSLEEFNTALMEIYPTLSEEEQLAVREAYSLLGLYLEDLLVETNSVFGREVLRIEEGTKSATDVPSEFLLQIGLEGQG